MNSGNTRKGTSINSIKALTYKYTRKCTSINRKRALTSLLKGNSRGSQGVWKDGALDGQLEDPRYRCATLSSNGEKPRSKLHDLDMRIQGSQ